ncbi:MAG: hypothetical protein Q7S12_03280 [bacterium]|nr:hypothetical protein [bacterium]
MKYDIYFHANCLDGAASAATLKYFLNLRGDDFAKYIPLQHPVNKKWWRSFKMEQPSAITDILYHPGAKIWFDHHPTTFIDNNWEKKFRKDDWHILDTKSPSCTGLILRTLSSRTESKIPVRLKELAKWADIIDRIDSKKISVKDLLELKSPAFQIGFFLDNESKVSLSRQKQLIDVLSKRPLASAANLPWVRRGFIKYKKKFDKSLLQMKKMLILQGKTVFIDNLERKVIGVRFAPYYFYPKSNYSIRFVQHGKIFILAVGVNPWNSPKKPADIGWFLEKNYGGGGHPYAGSAPFKTKEKALSALPQLIAYLNKHA